MPIYEYLCAVCGNREELITTWENRDNSYHCSCGNDMQRIMSIPFPTVMHKSTKELTFEALNGVDCTVKPEHRKQMADGFDQVKTIY